MTEIPTRLRVLERQEVRPRYELPDEGIGRGRYAAFAVGVIGLGVVAALILMWRGR